MTKALKYKGVTFDFKGSHLALTDPSQGGAASLMNDPVLLKANSTDQKLSEEHEKLLKEIGEEFTPLEKSGEVSKDTQSSSLREEEGDEKLNLNKGTDNDMSEELIKQMGELQSEVVALKIEKALTPYQFGEEVSLELSKAMAELSVEGQASVRKALDELVAMGEYGVALEKANAPVATPEVPENDLNKALSEEAGEGGEPEAEAGELSFLEKAMAAQDKMKEEKQ